MRIQFSKSTDGAEVYKVLDALDLARSSSRFDWLQEVMVVRGYTVINITMVRLRVAKPYCGNHPNECLVAGADRKARFLEGADWVSFNDLLNDVLDFHNSDANVSSSVVVVRKGKRRRIAYESEWVQRIRAWQWVKNAEDDDYEDFTGERGGTAPNSEYPDGTPGEYIREFPQRVEA